MEEQKQVHPHIVPTVGRVAAILWMAFIAGCTETTSPRAQDASNFGARNIVDNLVYAKAKNGLCFAVYIAPTHTVAIASIDCKQVGL